MDLSKQCLQACILCEKWKRFCFYVSQSTIVYTKGIIRIVLLALQNWLDAVNVTPHTKVFLTVLERAIDLPIYISLYRCPWLLNTESCLSAICYSCTHIRCPSISLCTDTLPSSWATRSVSRACRCPSCCHQRFCYRGWCCTLYSCRYHQHLPKVFRLPQMFWCYSVSVFVSTHLSFVVSPGRFLWSGGRSVGAKWSTDSWAGHDVCAVSLLQLHDWCRLVLASGRILNMLNKNPLNYTCEQCFVPKLSTHLWLPIWSYLTYLEITDVCSQTGRGLLPENYPGQIPRLRRPQSDFKRTVHHQEILEQGSRDARVRGSADFSRDVTHCQNSARCVLHCV